MGYWGSRFLRASITAAFAVAALTGALGVAPATVYAATSPTTLPSACVFTHENIFRAHGGSYETLNSGVITILNRPYSLNMKLLNLAKSPFTDRSRKLWWQSLVWAIPLVVGEGSQSKYQDAVNTTDFIGDLVVALKANPDPGSSTPQALKRSIATGWAEGENLRREETLNCLYAITGDKRLVTHLVASAKANLDERRYYGPPFHPVHNHGLMANQALIQTGKLLSRPGYVNAGTQRLLRDSQEVFSPAGLVFEQSLGYQKGNYLGWSQVADSIPITKSNKSALTQLRASLRRARNAVIQFTNPQGVLAEFGDGRDSGARLSTTQKLPLRFIDTSTGYASGRWSWTNTQTTFFAVRFGPTRKMHGHQDHGSFVWSTLGNSVIVDPGTYSYDTSLPEASWQSTAQAHNVAVPAKPKFINTASQLVSYRTSKQVSRLHFTIGTFTKPVSRDLRFDNSAHAASVTDKVAGSFTQHFHLDPCWNLASQSSTSAEFTCDGKTLTVTSSRGSTLSHTRGSNNGPGGWVFTGFETKAPAYELLVTGKNSVSTSFVVKVSPAEPVPTPLPSASPDPSATPLG